MCATMTRHAQARMQGRAIPADAIDLLLDFGASMRVRGADSFYFDQPARRRAAAELDRTTLRRTAKYLNAYAIVADDGSIVTAAWRTQRLRRA